MFENMNTVAGILDRTNLESVVHSATPAVIIRMTGNKYALRNDLSSSVPAVSVTVDVDVVVAVTVTSVVLLSISMSQGGSDVVAERVVAAVVIGLGKEMGKEKKRGKAKGKIKEMGQVKGKKNKLNNNRLRYYQDVLMSS